MTIQLYKQISQWQLTYLRHIREHPGCTAAELVRLYKWNPDAGHKWIYDSVTRMCKQGVIRKVASGRRNLLYVT